MEEEFAAVTGVDLETARMYLEMSGQQLDSAVMLYFSMNETSSTNATASSTEATQERDGWPHEVISLLFARSEGKCAVPEAWLLQGLQTSRPQELQGEFSQLSILQHRNGPCGVLAAYQAHLVVYLKKKGLLSHSYAPTQRDAAGALVLLLRTACSSPQSSCRVQICSWADPVNGIGGGIVERDIVLPDVMEGNTDDVSDSIIDSISEYLAPGGALLLLYSAVLSFGMDRLRGSSDILPLLHGPNSLCSSALMNIMLTGNARESLGAYDELGFAIPWSTPTPPVGFLSGTERELKMKIHDKLKFPANEVYVLHGRDHFTVFFIDSSVKMPHPKPFEEKETESEPITFTGFHFNGLPPAGPSVSKVLVSATDGVCRQNASTASQGLPKEYKPVVNSIDCIIQASPEDKKTDPKEWRNWTYEIALAIENPDDKTEARPANLPALPTFDLNKEDIDASKGWRCRSCFETRFSTMCFGQNDPATTHCQHCGRSRLEAGWTLWMPYSQIPPDWQSYIDRQYGPMFIAVLRTKWPNCQVSPGEGKDFPAV